MIDEPHLTQLEAQTIAFIHLKIPREQIKFVIDTALRELRMALASQGVKPIGPWFTHHRRVDPNFFDFEVCLPVGNDLVPAGRVEAGRMSESKVARTIYRGPYEGLAGAWTEFRKWIAAQGCKTEDEQWERYLAGPEKSDDPMEWETELSKAIE